MKLYMHPAATTSRPISLFAAEERIALQEIVVDLMTGEHRQPGYVALNPNGLVPMLEDAGFRLTEGSVILRYLADKVGSSAYPSDLRERARINEAMDWLSANLYRDLGFNFVYPLLFPHHRRRSEEGTQAAIAWGRERCDQWLTVLDRNMIGSDSDHLCLGRLTLADFLGSGIVSLAEAAGMDFRPYPNVHRWLSGMKMLPNWNRANGGFYRMIEQAAA